VIFLAMPDSYDPPDAVRDAASERVEAPVRALFQRGIADGTLRRELDVPTYVRFFAATIVAAVESGLPRTAGVEEAAALVTSLFLDGTRNQTGGAPGRT
jgi:TetR/AcrR family transcriptional repressor of mexCD-oprJ operon